MHACIKLFVVVVDGKYLPRTVDDFTNTTPKTESRFPHAQTEIPISYGSNDFIRE